MEDQDKILSQFKITNDRAGFYQLAKQINKRTKIAMEFTGIYSINLYLFLKKRGHDVRYIDTRRSKHHRKAGHTIHKSDPKDALALAKYRLAWESFTFSGEHHVDRLLAGGKSKEQRELLSLVNDFNHIIRESKGVKQRLTRLVDLRFPEAVHLFYQRACPTVCSALLHTKEDILRGRVPGVSAKLRDRVKTTVGQFDQLRDEFAYLYNQSRAIEESRLQALSKIEGFIIKSGYGRLLEIHGIGPVSAATLVTEGLPLKRFLRLKASGLVNKKRSIRLFKGYCGLGVTSKQTGEHEGGHCLSKGGNKAMKRLLFMLATGTLSRRKYTGSRNKEMEMDPAKYLEIYDRHRARGKKGLPAIVKIMDKISTDIFFVLLEVENARIAREASEKNQSTPCTAPVTSEAAPLQTTSP